MEKQISVTLPIDRYEQLLAIEKALTQRSCVVIREHDWRGKTIVVTYAFMSSRKFKAKCEAILNKAREIEEIGLNHKANSDKREEELLRQLEQAFPWLFPLHDYTQRFGQAKYLIVLLKEKMDKLWDENAKLRNRTLRDFIFK